MTGLYRQNFDEPQCIEPVTLKGPFDKQNGGPEKRDLILGILLEKYNEGLAKNEETARYANVTRKTFPWKEVFYDKQFKRQELPDDDW